MGAFLMNLFPQGTMTYAGSIMKLAAAAFAAYSLYQSTGDANAALKSLMEAFMIYSAGSATASAGIRRAMDSTGVAGTAAGKAAVGG